MRRIAVVAGSVVEYLSHVEMDLIPGLEKYHGVKILRNHADKSYRGKSDKKEFYIFYVFSTKVLMGLWDYQLVKCGTFYEREDINEIEEMYAQEVARRKKKPRPWG